jgi:erythromycin esterase-like protein
VPLGLVISAYLIWSGKMLCCGFGFGPRRDESYRPAVAEWREPHASGNRAFDQYRADTLRRLEEEQREFREFLEQLRSARDKAEFDQFMTERRTGFPPRSPASPD